MLLTLLSLSLLLSVAFSGRQTGRKRSRGVTHKEVEDLEADEEHQKKTESTEDALLQKQWDEHMHDFTVEDMLQIELAPG